MSSATTLLAITLYLGLSACTLGGFEISQLRSVDTTDKVSLHYASTQASDDQYNTVRNNATANDAKLFMHEIDLKVFESGKTSLTVSLQSLTPSTAKDLEIVELDLGNLNSSDWTLFEMSGEIQYLSKAIRYDISADGQIRQIQVQVQLWYNITQQKYISMTVGGIMLGSDLEGNDAYGITLH